MHFLHFFSSVLYLNICESFLNLATLLGIFLFKIIERLKLLNLYMEVYYPIGQKLSIEVVLLFNTPRHMCHSRPLMLLQLPLTF